MNLLMVGPKKLEKHHEQIKRESHWNGSTQHRCSMKLQNCTRLLFTILMLPVGSTTQRSEGVLYLVLLHDVHSLAPIVSVVLVIALYP